MDLEKLDARWERAKFLWGRAQHIWHNCLMVLFALVVVGIGLFIPYFVWDLAVHPATRHKVAQSEIENLKWYAVFGAASWLISKIWRKPKETQSAEQPSVQSSEPKGRRKNYRRVQGRR